MPRRPNGQQLSRFGKGDAQEASLTIAGRQDFTYKKLTGLELSGSNFRQSLFIGAIFQRCRFVSVCFDRCDFSGVKFVDCVFEHCTFVPDEIRSCVLNRCAFLDCNFRGSQWIRVQSEECNFDGCDFREASIRECEFHACNFSNCRLKRSSLTLDDFRNSRFKLVNLGDCTALFLFFIACDFDECHINAETLGFTYGLTPANLESLELVHLGRKQRKPKGTNIIGSLIASYWDRRWYVGACILELNFDHSTPLVSIRRATASIDAAARGGVISDWDELRFFLRVLRRVHGEQRLPLLGLWLFVTVLHRISDISQAELHTAGTPPLGEPVLVDANNLLLTVLDEITPILNLASSSEQVRLSLTLSERPQVPLSELIPREVFKAFGPNDVALISARPGSWIEYWQMGLAALAAIQVSFVAINGVTAQMLKTVLNIKRLKKEIAPKTSKPKATRKATSGRAKYEVVVQSQILLPIILQTDLRATRARGENLTPDRLEKLDVTLKNLNALTDEALDGFKAYSAAHIQQAAIRKAPNRKSKRVGRERQPAA
jgi:uncharacterized protein YjbI with pentapeptide repeats